MSNRLAALAAVSLATGTLALATGCNYGKGSYDCTGHTDACDEQGPDSLGTCVEGTCIYADSTCPSGTVFGGAEGDNAGKCTPVGYGSGSGISMGGPDGGGTTPPVDSGPSQPVCYGTGLVKVCFAQAPTQAFSVDNKLTIDTTSSAMCVVPMSGGDGYCVIPATTITINAELDATGSKPLILVASDKIMGSSAGLIDVSSHRDPTEAIGAGADPSSCGPGTLPGARAGGAGGSFGGNGGVGGNAELAAGGKPAAPVAKLDKVQGGCPGQAGDGTDKSGGHGGGAIFMIAVNSIDFSGSISAGGESGVGGVAGKNGGGGAGAGGMIGFDASSVTVGNTVFANGGSGGGGSSTNTAGHNGNDGAGPQAAGGGAGGGNGGTGGDGSFGLSVSGNDGSPGTNSNTDGGAGGGGGTGVIKAPATATLPGNISPAPTP